MSAVVHDLESAKEFFKGDLYATEVTGIEILEAGPGRSKVGLTITPQHRNAAGAVMGAVYFTMADFAFAVAANFGHGITVTTSSDIQFLTGTKGNTLFAETACVKEGNHTCLYRTEVRDDLGTLVALVTASGYRK